MLSAGEKEVFNILVNLIARRDYYKVFPMKDFCKSLPQRKDINPVVLSKTKWFSEKLSERLRF